MSYDMVFYAIDGQKFAKHLQKKRDQLLAKVRKNMSPEDYEPEEIAFCLLLAERVCRGEFLELSEEEEDDAEDFGFGYCSALGHIAEIVGEEILLDPFLHVRRWAFFEQIGIWPLLSQTLPPFPIPQSDEVPPDVGYLSWKTMQGKTDEDIERMLAEHSRIPEKIKLGIYESGPVDEGLVNQARIQFAEAAESVFDEKLDLLAIV